MGDIAQRVAKRLAAKGEYVIGLQYSVGGQDEAIKEAVDAGFARGYIVGEDDFLVPANSPEEAKANFMDWLTGYGGDAYYETEEEAIAAIENSKEVDLIQMANEILLEEQS
jgi:hypothetical protein